MRVNLYVLVHHGKCNVYRPKGSSCLNLLLRPTPTKDKDYFNPFTQSPQPQAKMKPKRQKRLEQISELYLMNQINQREVKQINYIILLLLLLPHHAICAKTCCGSAFFLLDCVKNYRGPCLAVWKWQWLRKDSQWVQHFKSKWSRQLWHDMDTHTVHVKR